MNEMLELICRISRVQAVTTAVDSRNPLVQSLLETPLQCHLGLHDRTRCGQLGLFSQDEPCTVGIPMFQMVSWTPLMSSLPKGSCPVLTTGITLGPGRQGYHRHTPHIEGSSRGCASIKQIYLLCTPSFHLLLSHQNTMLPTSDNWYELIS